MLGVIVVGLGPIGLGCAHAITEDRRMRLVGLVDTDPARQGRTLEELDEQNGSQNAQQSFEQESSLTVAPTLDQALADRQADVAIVTTSSRLTRVLPILNELLHRHIAVVSSCEELAWPWYQYPQEAQELDELARHAGRAVLGTGVNPGLVMDTLAVVLATAVRRVSSVRCIRRVDASLRRPSLQAKIGVTLTPEQFHQKAASRCRPGHVGLAESLAMLAAGLGRRVEYGSIQLTLEPVIAQQAIHSALGLVEPGRVAGVHQQARWSDDQLSLELDLTMAVGLPDPKDVIEINGPVALRCKVPGGVPGDSATVAMLVNYAVMLPELPPGLRTMLDVPPAGCRGWDEP